MCCFMLLLIFVKLSYGIKIEQISDDFEKNILKVIQSPKLENNHQFVTIIKPSGKHHAFEDAINYIAITREISIN